MSLRESAATGDRLETLRQLRDYLANAIEACESMRDLAALSTRLQSVLLEIAELEPKKAAGDGIDEIARRRAARRPSAGSGSSRSSTPR